MLFESINPRSSRGRPGLTALLALLPLLSLFTALYFLVLLSSMNHLVGDYRGLRLSVLSASLMFLLSLLTFFSYSFPHFGFEETAWSAVVVIMRIYAMFLAYPFNSSFMPYLLAVSVTYYRCMLPPDIRENSPIRDTLERFKLGDIENIYMALRSTKLRFRFALFLHMALLSRVLAMPFACPDLMGYSRYSTDFFAPGFEDPRFPTELWFPGTLFLSQCMELMHWFLYNTSVGTYFVGSSSYLISNGHRLVSKGQPFFYIQLRFLWHYFEKLSPRSGYTLDLDPYFLEIQGLFIPPFEFDALGLLLDPLSLSMALLVSLVHLTTQLFSLSYMGGEPDRVRFSLLLLLFSLSMLLMVHAPGLFQLFVGWELIGLSSYLLIGFWGHRAMAMRSAFKAVAFNRLGDTALLLSMVLAYLLCGTGLFGPLSVSILSEYPPILFDLDLRWFMAALILLASATKSAQFLLSPWLPDAMEGPTPVSALLHSATMVTAGVYLSIRFPAFHICDFKGLTNLCLVLGALTATLSSFAAVGQYDLKRIVAHSTTSNLGLMFMSMGLGQFGFAHAHLLIHGLYKGMLFQVSGLAISMSGGNQDIRRLHPVFLSPLPMATLLLSLSASFALPGLPSFYSKEPIVLATSYPTNSYLELVHGLALVLVLSTVLFSVRPILRLVFDPSSIPRPSLSGWFLSLPFIVASFALIALGGPIVSLFDPLASRFILPFSGPYSLSHDFYPFSSSSSIPVLLPLILGFLSVLGRLPRFDLALSDPFGRLLPSLSLAPISFFLARVLEHRATPALGHEVWFRLAELFGISIKLSQPFPSNRFSPTLSVFLFFAFLIISLIPLMSPLTPALFPLILQFRRPITLSSHCRDS